MKRFIVLCAATLALASPAAWAQVGTVRGKVVDEKGQVVVDAKVAIDFKGARTRHYETKTNKKGEYTQVGLDTGVYRFSVSKEGYVDTSVEALVKLGEVTELPNLILTSKAAAVAAASGGYDLQAAFSKALELVQADKLDEAEAAYKEILSKRPGVPEAYFNLGVIAQKKKDVPAAAKAYEKALELRPDYADALLNLAQVYKDAGTPEKANELMAKASASVEKDPKLLFNQAVMLLNEFKNAEAEPLLKKVLALDPNYAEAYFQLASVCLNLQREDEALAHYDKYLSLNPTITQNVETAKAVSAYLKGKLKK